MSYINSDNEIELKKLEQEIAQDFKDNKNKEIIIVCIGTNNVISDSLGPFIGTMLQEYNYFHIPVYGTIHKPIHALNIHNELNIIKKSHKYSYILAIDACIGENIGEICFEKNPIFPGKAIDVDLGQVGDSSITGITTIGYAYNDTRLSLIYSMAKKISKCIYRAYTNNKNIYSSNNVLNFN